MNQLIQTLRDLPALQGQPLVGVGISGGLDSMVLAHALHRADIPFRALHFNHNWRGAASRSDQQLVRNWCRQRKIPFITQTWKSPVKSEAAAREARLRFFQFAAQKYDLTAILLGHHRDDLAETFLLQLLRGSGPEGLASLLPEREVSGLRLIRPLLKFSRADLTRIAKAEGLLWREDSTNTDESFTRNKVRRRLLPYLKKFSERDPLPLFSRTADILATENDYWESLLPKTLPAKLPIKSLKSQHPAYQRRLLRQWLLEHTQTAPSFEDIESVRTLLTQTTPAKVNLKESKHCRRRAGFLFIE